NEGHGEPHPKHARHVRGDRLLETLHLAARGEETRPRHDSGRYRECRDRATEFHPKGDQDPDAYRQRRQHVHTLKPPRYEDTSENGSRAPPARDAAEPFHRPARTSV